MHPLALPFGSMRSFEVRFGWKCVLLLLHAYGVCMYSFLRRFLSILALLLYKASVWLYFGVAIEGVLKVAKHDQVRRLLCCIYLHFELALAFD